MSRIPAIIEALESGKSVLISTHLRSTAITPKTLKTWRERGHELFRESKGSDYMANGKRFVCIDYCTVSIY